jgi:hypothetical protein
MNFDYFSIVFVNRKTLPCLPSIYQFCRTKQTIFCPACFPSAFFSSNLSILDLPLWFQPAGHVKLVQLLRTAKADITLPNKAGKTAAEVAKTPEVAKAVSE